MQGRSGSAAVAIGVSADRDAIPGLGVPLRMNTHGRHGGRPLQECRPAKHIRMVRVVFPLASMHPAQYSLDGKAGVSYTSSVTPLVLERIYVQANDYEFDRASRRPPAARRPTQLASRIGVSTGEISFATTDFGGDVHHVRYR